MIYTEQTDDQDVTAWALPEGAIARLGRGRIRGGLAFSPDGGSLAVATDIGCWWYNLNTMLPRALWNTERGMVTAISFSHNAQWLATANMDGIVKVWDTQTLQCVAKIEVYWHVTCLMFSPDGNHLAVSGGRWAAVYGWQVDATTPVENFTFTSNAGVSTAFSPDGSLFAYKSNDNMTSVIYVETGEIIAEFSDVYAGTEASVGRTTLVFSPCGQYLAGCNGKNLVHVWNVRSDTLEMEPTEYNSFQVIPAYTANGTLCVAARYQREIVLWDAKSQEKSDTFRYLGGRLGAACFSVDGRQFAATSRYDYLHVWTKGASKVVSLREHLQPDPVQRFPRQMFFSKDSRTLVCGKWRRVEMLSWDISRRIEQTFSPDPSEHSRRHIVSTVSRDAELIATANGSDSIIKVWHVPSGRQVAELQKNPRLMPAMTFSLTGEYLVSSIIKRPSRVWHVSSGRQVAELTQKEKPLEEMGGGTRIGFSPTGEYFFSIRKQSIAVWNTSRWEYLYESSLQRFKRFGTLVRFHPNGKHFFTGPREGETLIWDLKSGARVGSLSTATCLNTTLYRGMEQDIQRVVARQDASPRRIRGLETSPCGTLIAGSMFDEIRVWDAATLETQIVMIPPAGCQKSYTLAFSPCSKYLTTGAWWQEGQTKTAIRLWEIATGENIHTFWAHPTDIDRLRFSPDGELLASGSYDGTILLWDMKPYL